MIKNPLNLEQELSEKIDKPIYDNVPPNTSKTITIGNAKRYIFVALAYDACFAIGRTTVDGSHDFYSIYDNSSGRISVDTSVKGQLAVTNMGLGGLGVFILYL